jgi:RNA polymerase sigma-70 factor (ECF subfamily)
LTLQVRQVLHRESRFRRRFDSSDLVQETMLKAHERLGQFAGSTEAEFVKWLQEILANTLIDAARHARARKRDIAMERSMQAALHESSARIEAYLAANGPSPSKQAERKELLLCVAEAVNQLPEDQREVIIQRDFLGAKVADIAAALDRSEKAVAGLLFRGRQRLRELLAKLE